MVTMAQFYAAQLLQLVCAVVLIEDVVISP